MELGENWMRAQRDGTYIYGKRLAPADTYTLDGRQCPPHEKHDASFERCGVPCPPDEDDSTQTYTFYGALTCQKVPPGFLPNMDGLNPAYGLMSRPEETFRLDANNDPEKCPAHQIHKTNVNSCDDSCPPDTYSSEYHDSCQPLGPNQIRNPITYGYLQLPSETKFPVQSEDGSITYDDCPPHQKFDAANYLTSLPVSAAEACIDCSSPGDMQYTSEAGAPCASITVGQMRDPDGYGQVNAPPPHEYYDYSQPLNGPLVYKNCPSLFRHNPSDPSQCIPDTSSGGEDGVEVENVFFNEDGELVGGENIDEATGGIQLTGVRECVDLGAAPPEKSTCPPHYVRGAVNGTYGEAVSCTACTHCDVARGGGNYYTENPTTEDSTIEPIEPIEVTEYCKQLMPGYSRIEDVYGARNDIAETYYYNDGDITQCREHHGHDRLNASDCVPCHEIKGVVDPANQGKTYFTYVGGSNCEELSLVDRVGYVAGYEPPDISECITPGDDCEIPVYKNLNTFQLFGDTESHDSANNGLHKDARLDMNIKTTCDPNSKSSLTIRMVDEYVRGTCSSELVCDADNDSDIPTDQTTLPSETCAQFTCTADQMSDKSTFPDPGEDRFSREFSDLATNNAGVFNLATNECVVTDCLHNTMCTGFAD